MNGYETQCIILPLILAYHGCKSPWVAVWLCKWKSCLCETDNEVNCTRWEQQGYHTSMHVVLMWSPWKLQNNFLVVYASQEHISRALSHRRRVCNSKNSNQAKSVACTKILSTTCWVNWLEWRACVVWCVCCVCACQCVCACLHAHVCLKPL